MSKRLISTVGLVKIYRDAQINEYLCEHPDNVEAHYHTDDALDAMETASAMDRSLIHEDVVRMVELAW